MAEAFIVDALRSPTGKRNGSLATVHGADLGAHVIKALVERNGVPAEDYDDVIFGCVDTIGSLAGDIARTSWLAAGMPMCVPGTTIDRQCGSSQQAVHFAAQAVMSGTQDVILAGGVQTMSAIPISSAMLAGQPLGFTTPFAESKGWQARFGDAPVNQFYAAQRIADHWGLSRADMEVFAKESHDRALRAMAEGRFDREIVPFGDFRMDETARASTLEKLATLQPVDPTYPKITAAVSSSTCDAAAAVLVVSEAALKDDIDLVEINEAFASVVMAWLKETRYPHERTNVNGGAIALGHPLGASGVKLMTTLLHELERTGGRYGLQTMCEGGGQANVTILERL